MEEQPVARRDAEPASATRCRRFRRVTIRGSSEADSFDILRPAAGMRGRRLKACELIRARYRLGNRGRQNGGRLSPLIETFLLQLRISLMLASSGRLVTVATLGIIALIAIALALLFLTTLFLDVPEKYFGEDSFIYAVAQRTTWEVYLGVVTGAIALGAWIGRLTGLW
jgi:hypothetical protein